MITWIKNNIFLSIVVIAIGGFFLYNETAAWHVAPPQGYDLFDATTFEQAQAQDKTIIIDTFAPWCPTCRMQKEGLHALTTDPRLAEAVFMYVDYDAQPEALTLLKAQSQSTIIIFKGQEEVARAVGITNTEKIKNFVWQHVL